jgi:non-specific protein-tyrosine kinase
MQDLMAGWEDNYTRLLSFTKSTALPKANYLAIAEPAQASSNPVRPRVLLNTLLASVVGLFLALGFIFVREYFDDTLKSGDDLSRSLDLTALGAISRIKGRQYQDKQIAASQNPFSPVAEAYRMIRSNIQFMSVDRPTKAIMITSAVPGEGKSTTAANLGVIMAQAGLKTIIVDTDLRRPVQHEIFQVPNLGGLTELLRSPELEIGSHLRHTKVDNLRILTAGVLPPNPAELLSSQRMGQLLANLNELADVLIYDSPPVLMVTDAAVLSSRVDGTVLVIQAGRTHRSTIRQAMANLQHANARLLGGVLNRVSEKKGSYYYHLSYYATNGQESGQNNQRLVRQQS